MDGKTFVNCRYTNCKLFYSGGECTWITSTFQNCQVILQGPAQHTATFLAGLGIAPPSGTQLPPTGQFGFPKKPNGVQ